jgi:hypothetical protein
MTPMASSSVRLLRELGCQHQYASALTQLGNSCLAAGDAAAARDHWQQALDILVGLSHPDADQVRGMLQRQART